MESGTVYLFATEVSLLPEKEVGSRQLSVKNKEVGRALPDKIVLSCSEKRWAMPTLQQHCQLPTANFAFDSRTTTHNTAVL